MTQAVYLYLLYDYGPGPSPTQSHGLSKTRKVDKGSRVSTCGENYAGMTLATASMRAGPAVGGDSRVVSKYAVRRRSVARSSKEASTAGAGAAVCDAELDARGSVVNLLVHWER